MTTSSNKAVKTVKEVEEVKEVKELSVIEKMIKEINETTDKINLDGKLYTTVAKRNEILRKHLGFDVKIRTKHINIDNDKVIFECKIYIWKNESWHLVANGHAEESRSSTEINKKAAVENAETSALGRALANLGLTGGEFASMNEMAVKTGLIAKADSELVAHTKSLIKLSGINEKALLTSLSIKSFDTLKEEDALKIIKKCLAAIKSKKVPNKSESKDEQEEDIRM